MVRIDMSEYMEKYSVSRLIGAPPGYVGYDEADSSQRQSEENRILLYYLMRSRKHIRMYQCPASVLDDGRITDSQQNRRL